MPITIVNKIVLLLFHPIPGWACDLFNNKVVSLCNFPHGTHKDDERCRMMMCKRCVQYV